MRREGRWSNLHARTRPAEFTVRRMALQQALETAHLAEQQWKTLAERSKDALYAQTAVRFSKRYVALLFEEILWRYPRVPNRHALQAQLASNWAISGSERAMHWLRLVGEGLEGSAEDPDAALGQLSIPGFVLEPIQVPGAQGDAPRWLLKIALADPDWMTSMSGGGVLSVRSQPGGQFEVNQVGGLLAAVPWGKLRPDPASVAGPPVAGGAPLSCDWQVLPPVHLGRHPIQAHHRVQALRARYLLGDRLMYYIHAALVSDLEAARPPAFSRASPRPFAGVADGGGTLPLW